ncbi:hypothetical protein [Mycobacterium marinum]|uniref:hypothetical protein n=1 Tax=Mycobacterium marinum TaxID=1781 RepID=UPI003561E462
MGPLYPESRVRAEVQPLSQPQANRHPLQLYPLVEELAAAGAPIRVAVAVSCRVLKLHRQRYFAWLSCPVADAEYEEA